MVVRVAPLIDGQPLSETTRANQGMKVKLMCSILEGDPPIEIKWYKEDSNTPVVSSHTISLQNSEDYSLLTFKSVEHNDMGRWYDIPISLLIYSYCLLHFFTLFI